MEIVPITNVGVMKVMSNPTVIDQLLSKGEQTVYEYIRTQAQERGSIKESMSVMADKLGTSEATVHRAIRKLYKEGIIGIVPSKEKAESNEILFYGFPDEEQQVDEILEMVTRLNMNVNRFQTILAKKDQELEQLKRDKKAAYKQIDDLREQLKQLDQTITTQQQTIETLQTGGELFSQGKVVSSTPLGDGKFALIVQQ